MTVTQIIASVKNGGYDIILEKLYGGKELERQKDRYISLAEGFREIYGDKEAAFYSVPGRTEVSGNHTDHNRGKVIAASVYLDIISIASPSEDGIIKIKSDGYRESVIDTSAVSPEKAKKGSSASLVEGVVGYFKNNGLSVGGFTAYTKSDVVMGSGISSSAAFEVMIGNILSFMYNGGTVAPITLAKAGKYAENEYFGKPCGLMDQAACATGGLCYIDFENSENPFTEKLDFAPEKAGYVLCLVNTGGSHAKLTDEYGSLPFEMKKIASMFGKEVLRDVPEELFCSKIAELRKTCGDRAVLRAIHFYNENRRVESQREAIKRGDIDAFFADVVASGNSSFKYLQNVFCVTAVEEQGLSIALALCDKQKAVSRVHGGGFAGTVQAWVKYGKEKEFENEMNSVFGENCCLFTGVRPYGAVKVLESEIEPSGK